MTYIEGNKSDFIGRCPTNVEHRIKLQNYKNYTACLETLGRAINRPCHFRKNFAWAIHRPHTKYSFKGLDHIAEVNLY